MLHYSDPILYLVWWCSTRFLRCGCCPDFDICCQLLKYFYPGRDYFLCRGGSEAGPSPTAGMSNQIALRSEVQHTRVRPSSVYSLHKMDLVYAHCIIIY